MSDSPLPSHSFHGSNSSSSKDNGSGSRNYHIPNHATSYANDRSKLISVKFEEDKGVTKAMMGVISIFLFFAAVPICLAVLRYSLTAEYGSFLSPIQTHNRLAENPTEGIERTWEEPQSRKVGTKDTQTSASHYHEATHEATKEVKSISDVYWSEPLPNPQCSGFGSREYTARLWNLPYFSTWLEACRETEIKIHNVVIRKPTFCESKWPFGVTGHWIIDFEEKDCLARWGNIVDKGCVAESLNVRRFQARLWDIDSKQDWMTICRSAPVVIMDVSISKPTFCDNRGWWGIYGIWDVEDQSCD